MRYRATFIMEEPQRFPIGTDIPILNTHGVLESWAPMMPTDGQLIAAALEHVAGELREQRYKKK
jgi:hypothetical protein